MEAPRCQKQALENQGSKEERMECEGGAHPANPELLGFYHLFGFRRGGLGSERGSDFKLITSLKAQPQMAAPPVREDEKKPTKEQIFLREGAGILVCLRGENCREIWGSSYTTHLL